MKFYFYSPFLCYLSFGGEIIDKLCSNVRCVEAPKSAVFDIYIDGCYPSVVSDCGYINNANVFDYYDGKLVIPKRELLTLKYRRIATKTATIGGTQYLAELYNDGQTKITVYSYHDQMTFTVPFQAEDFSLFPIENYLCIEAGEKVKRIAFLRIPDLNLSFCANCARYEAGKTLSIERFFVGAGSYSYFEHYDITYNFALLGKSARVLRQEGPSPLLKSLAFLERVKLGADFSEYLAPSIADKANVITSFLGEYDSILPPCDSKNPNTFAIIKKDGVKYVDFSFSDGRISDVEVSPYPKNV